MPCAMAARPRQEAFAPRLVRTRREAPGPGQQNGSWASHLLDGQRAGLHLSALGRAALLAGRVRRIVVGRGARRRVKGRRFAARANTSHNASNSVPTALAFQLRGTPVTVSQSYRVEDQGVDRNRARRLFPVAVSYRAPPRRRNFGRLTSSVTSSNTTSTSISQVISSAGLQSTRVDIRRGPSSSSM